MSLYKDFKHPVTGNAMRKLTYSENDFQMIKDFIDENYNEDYTLSFFDTLTNLTIEFDNKVSEVLNDIPYIVSTISSIEHTFCHWIGVNRLSDSYVVSIDISRGILEVNNIYHFNTDTKKIEKKV